MNIPHEEINVPLMVPLPRRLLEKPIARKIFRRQAWKHYLDTGVACRLFNLRDMQLITLQEWTNGTQRYLWRFAIQFASHRRGLY
jgi:hypothetical protein